MVLDKVYSGLAILAVIGAAVGYHYWTVTSLEKSLLSCKNNYNTLSIATDLQTAEITRLKTLGDIIAGNLKAAESTNTLLRVEVDALKGKINRPVPNTCEGQMQYILENVSEANKLWKK